MVTICACADKGHSDQDCEIIINLKYWMRRHEFMCALVAYWNVHGKALFSTNLTKAINISCSSTYRMLTRVVTLKCLGKEHVHVLKFVVHGVIRTFTDRELAYSTWLDCRFRNLTAFSPF